MSLTKSIIEEFKKLTRNTNVSISSLIFFENNNLDMDLEIEIDKDVFVHPLEYAIMKDNPKLAKLYILSGVNIINSLSQLIRHYDLLNTCLDIKKTKNILIKNEDLVIKNFKDSKIKKGDKVDIIKLLLKNNISVNKIKQDICDVIRNDNLVEFKKLSKNLDDVEFYGFLTNAIYNSSENIFVYMLKEFSNRKIEIEENSEKYILSYDNKFRNIYEKYKKREVKRLTI